MSIVGIDASFAQPGFNWKQAAAEGAAFGLCKLTEGTGLVDNQSSYHWRSIKEAGLARGCYGFSRWDLRTRPQDEADFFLAHMPTLDTFNFVVLDLEDSPDHIPAHELSSWALTWLETVEKAIGFPPIIYSGYSFAQHYLTDPRLARYGKWVAAYGPWLPSMAAPWSQVAFWQFTNERPFAGELVDASDFFGTLDQLHSYGKPSADGTGGPGRVLVLVDMIARYAPEAGAVHFGADGHPEQMVYKGATLDSTGQTKDGWVQVVAGGNKVWVLASNTKRV